MGECKSENCGDMEGAFLEYWTFRISIATVDEDAIETRNKVIHDIKTQGGDRPATIPAPETLDDLHLIQRTIEELAEDRLSDLVLPSTL